MNTHNVELMLLGWTQTHNGGSKLTFQVSDDDLDQFRGMTVKKGNTAGQRFMAALVEIGPDEQPVPVEEKQPLGSRAFLAVKWCKDQRFRDWVAKRYGIDDPRDAILTICRIGSRRELDENPDAWAAFDDRFRKPYNEHLNLV